MSAERAERASEARRRAIGEAVTAAGSKTLKELAEEFDVSLVTIHRDLTELEQRGVVRRHRGGATTMPAEFFHSQLSYRMTLQLAEKQAVAAAALKYVEPGSSILLDDSTTVFQMIAGLPQRAPLQVATTFVPGLTRLFQLAGNHDISVIGLGGLYDVGHDAVLGLQTIQQVRGIHINAAFLSCRAVSTEGAFHPDEDVVALKRAMMDVASSKYLLVDNTKINRMALLEVGALEEFDLIIIDSQADPEVLTAWREAGIKYELAAVR
jgi:DeoR/GlpR family transcriptional regulator of sugar metabolism